jgi:hypothetical protein
MTVSFIGCGHYNGVNKCILMIADKNYGTLFWDIFFTVNGHPFE